MEQVVFTVCMLDRSENGLILHTTLKLPFQRKCLMVFEIQVNLFKGKTIGYLDLLRSYCCASIN